MSDSTERRLISRFRGRSLDREGLTDLTEMAGPTDSPVSSRGQLWCAPCGHAFCRADEWGDLYPGTDEWEADGGCSLQDRRVSSAAPTGGVSRVVGVSDVDGLAVRVCAVAGLRRLRLRVFAVIAWAYVVGLLVIAGLVRK